MTSHRAARRPRRRRALLPLLLAALVLMVLAGIQVTPVTQLSLEGARSQAAKAAETARAEKARAEKARGNALGHASRDTRRAHTTTQPPSSTTLPAEVIPDTTTTTEPVTDPPQSASTTTTGSTTGPAPTGGTTSSTPVPTAPVAPAAPAGPAEQVTATPVAAPARGPAAGRTLAFNDEFDTLELGAGKKWGHKTTSYEFGDHNPNHYKRDWITPDAMRVADGVMTMTATRRDSFYWNTGLLTTQNAHGVGGNGFRVQAGDFLVNRVMLPTGNTGAWPGLWTWDGPDGEVDAFEWHTDVPDVLEFTNHVRSGSHYYSNSNLVAPGKWVWIGVKLGSDSNTWYVGDTLDGMQAAYSDNTGIGDLRPYVIANLSVNVSPWHPSPSGSTPIVYKLDTVRVYR